MTIPQYQKEAKNFILALSSAMEAHIQKRYNDPKFVLARKNISFARGRVRSWGGIFVNRRRGPNYGRRMAGYSLAMGRYASAIAYDRKTWFNEYKHIKNDPEIGSVYGVSWKKAVAALVAHEVAHAVQYACSESVKNSAEYGGFRELQLNRGRKNIGHGRLFQFIYRDLRNTFVNNDAFENIAFKKVKKTTKKNKARSSNKSEKKNVTVYKKQKRYNKDTYVVAATLERFVFHKGYETAELIQMRWQDKENGMKTFKVVNELHFSDGRKIEVKNKWEAKRLIAEYFGMERI